MAEMETIISNPEFIRSLEKNRTALNSAFDYYNSGISRIEPDDIFKIFSVIMNPLFDNGFKVQDIILISIFKSLLNLISKKMIGEKGKNKELEKHLFTVAERYKNLLAVHGGTFIINILNALINLDSKKNLSAAGWAFLISTLPEDINIDDFRTCGFIAAWICGAASAGETAAEYIKNTDPGIIKKFFNINDSENINPSAISEKINKNPWSDPVSAIIDDNNLPPVFKTAGGFKGYGYEFRSRPSVVSIEEKFYVTDGFGVFRLYGDFFGIELVREKSLNPEKINAGGVINRFVKENNFIWGNRSYPLPAEWRTGISTIAFNSHTVVWTLNDSYKLYIAGIRKNC